MTESKTHPTRRQFLATAAATAAAPMIVPAGVLGQNAPSNRITIGCIGVRGMGGGNMRSFLRFNDVRVVAVCDVDANVLKDRADQVDKHYKDNGCRRYKDYREVVDRDDIDAISIGTPDHWHAAIAIAAARNGKDIYCEKPITHTYLEGAKLVKVVNEHKRIWQTGSWQRSVWQFRQAVAIVRNGLIGDLRHVEVGLPSGNPYPPPAQPQTPPAELDYDMWVGPSEKLPYMNERLHGKWRWNYYSGGGQLMDWIGHHNDIAHWGMGEDTGGPVLIDPARFDFPREKDVWDAAYRYEINCQYASGVTTRLSNLNRMGVLFLGSKGWVWVNRRGFQASNPDWTKREFNPGPVEVYQSDNHQRNFVDCIKTRKKTITPVEVSHHSIVPGHLGLIGAALGRRHKIRWDPGKGEIINDAAATKLLMQQGDRNPWKPWRREYAQPLLT